MTMMVQSLLLLALAFPAIASCSAATQPHGRGDNDCDIDVLLQTMMVGEPVQARPVPLVLDHTYFKEIERNAVSACLLPPNAKWCTVNLGGDFREFKMAVYDDSDIVSRAICRHGTWELTYDDVAALGKPGHALDIGANIGFYTLLMAATGWNVTSFEPMPENSALIEASLCQNPLLKSRVKLYKVGLGPKDDHCSIFSDSSNVGDGITHCGSNTQEKIRPGYVKRADITIRRLDDILAQQKVKSIEFVKIDVEGFECQVMSGAHSLLSKFRPKLIQSEVWPQMRGCSPGQYLSSFADAHYKVAKDKLCHTQDQSAVVAIDDRYMCRESIAGTNALSLLHVPGYHRSIVWFSET